MKRVVSLFLCLYLGQVFAYPYYIGDVNNDGSLSIADVTQLMNIIMGKTSDYNKRLADVNEDGSVTIADVTELVNIILGKSEPKELVETDTLFIYYSDEVTTYSLPSNWEQYVSVTVNGGAVNVVNTNETTEYVTVLIGTCSNGSFTYTGTYKTTIVLKGVELTNPSGEALDIECGKRINLELAEGTANKLCDGESGSQKAALYCKGHLEISKGGQLTVTGKKKHAIASKEYIEIKKTCGNIIIDAAVGDGIHAGQYFQMNGGEVNISGVTGDGIQAEATTTLTDENNGQLIVKGGTLDISLTGNDVSALKCDSILTISDGKIAITSTGDDVKAIKSNTDINITGGELNIKQSGSYLLTPISTDGSVTYDPSFTTSIKAEGNINIAGGTFVINNTADGGRGLNADGNLNVTGGDLTVNANGQSGILENNSSTSTTSYRVFVAIPTRTNQGGFPGGNTQYWTNVYLYDSSNNQIAQLTNQTTLTVNNTTKTFFYYDFGTEISGTYYFMSDSYTSYSGIYNIRSANFNISLTGNDAYYEISNTYSTSNGTRTFSISNVTSTWSSATTANAEGDTYKAACLKSDGNITVTDGILTLSHNGNISKGLKADGTVQIDGGTLTDKANGGYMIVGTDPGYCTSIKCTNYIGNGGTLNIDGSGEASRGISADGELSIYGGNYLFILSGDGSTFIGNGETDGAASVGLKSEGNMNLQNGSITIENTARGGKGIKIGNSSATGTKGAQLTIGTENTSDGPTLTITTSGSYLSRSGSGMNEDYIGSTKAIKCMGPIVINGGNISLTTQTTGAEGMESKYTITFNGGTFKSCTYDDAINAASTITINNGNIWAHASNNDAIDSNSASGQNGIVINGGIVLASAANSPEEAYDCDNANFILNGGVVIGTGGSQGGGGGGTPTSATQAYATVSSVSLEANTYISIKNNSGTVLASYKMPRSNSRTTIHVSHPQLTSNSSATVVYNSTAINGYSNALWNGSYSTGATSITGGTSKSVTMKK